MNDVSGPGMFLESTLSNKNVTGDIRCHTGNIPGNSNVKVGGEEILATLNVCLPCLQREHVDAYVLLIYRHG